jgi:hypothetical protein
MKAMTQSFGGSMAQPPLDQKSFSSKNRHDSPTMSQYATQSNMYDTTKIINQGFKKQYQT